jgi:hypothetical protein
MSTWLLSYLIVIALLMVGAAIQEWWEWRKGG